MEELKYPIGKFDLDKPISDEAIQPLISEIAALPGLLKDCVSNLTFEQLETPYRPGGWTVKQVVHHLVDSHMNAYIRFQLSLTETEPTIKPYKEDLWAKLPFKAALSVASSLQLLELLHANLVILLQSMSAEDFNRSYIHPEYNRNYTLKQALGNYAWHGQHHLAHITKLIDRNFDR